MMVLLWVLIVLAVLIVIGLAMNLSDIRRYMRMRRM
ncbi:MAG: hypothetical protein QOE35_3004 [Actinomycetota bacterium]|jgi:hypothetical protein